jgi:chemotaxis protein MotA
MNRGIRMDIVSIIGTIVAVVFILFGILTGGSILTFIDIPSIFIVVGGTAGSLLISSRKHNAKQLLNVFSLIFKEKNTNTIETIEKLAGWSATARKEGLLSLENITEGIDDPFIKKGLSMIIDGVEPDSVKTILELKLKGINERHKSNRALLDTGAALAPAFGMIGTLIGLINMLKTMSDPSTIGPSMAVALITTFYGSLLANVVFMPASKKLKAKTTEEILQKEMMIEGLLSIQAGENPNLLKEKLLAFLNEEENQAYGMQSELRSAES